MKIFKGLQQYFLDISFCSKLIEVNNILNIAQIQSLIISKILITFWIIQSLNLSICIDNLDHNKDQLDMIFMRYLHDFKAINILKSIGITSQIILYILGSYSILISLLFGLQIMSSAQIVRGLIFKIIEFCYNKDIYEYIVFILIINIAFDNLNNNTNSKANFIFAFMILIISNIFMLFIKWIYIDKRFLSPGCLLIKDNFFNRYSWTFYEILLIFNQVNTIKYIYIIVLVLNIIYPLLVLYFAWKSYIYREEEIQKFHISLIGIYLISSILFFLECFFKYKYMFIIFSITITLWWILISQIWTKRTFSIIINSNGKSYNDYRYQYMIKGFDLVYRHNNPESIFESIIILQAHHKYCKMMECPCFNMEKILDSENYFRPLLINDSNIIMKLRILINRIIDFMYNQMLQCKAMSFTDLVFYINFLEHEQINHSKGFFILEIYKKLLHSKLSFREKILINMIQIELIQKVTYSTKAIEQISYSRILNINTMTEELEMTIICFYKQILEVYQLLLETHVIFDHLFKKSQTAITSLKKIIFIKNELIFGKELSFKLAFLLSHIKHEIMPYLCIDSHSNSNNQYHILGYTHGIEKVFREMHQDRSAIIMVDISKHKGKILQKTANFYSFFEYNNGDSKSLYIDNIMPTFYSKIHQDFVENFFKTYSGNIETMNDLHHEVFCRTSADILFPVDMSFFIEYLDHNLCTIITFKKINMNENYYIICDEKQQILSMSLDMLKDLDITQDNYQKIRKEYLLTELLLSINIEAKNYELGLNAVDENETSLANFHMKSNSNLVEKKDLFLVVPILSKVSKSQNGTLKNGYNAKNMYNNKFRAFNVQVASHHRKIFGDEINFTVLFISQIIEANQQIYNILSQILQRDSPNYRKSLIIHKINLSASGSYLSIKGRSRKSINYLKAEPGAENLNKFDDEIDSPTIPKMKAPPEIKFFNKITLSGPESQTTTKVIKRILELSINQETSTLNKRVIFEDENNIRRLKNISENNTSILSYRMKKVSSKQISKPQFSEQLVPENSEDETSNFKIINIDIRDVDNNKDNPNNNENYSSNTKQISKKEIAKESTYASSNSTDYMKTVILQKILTKYFPFIDRAKILGFFVIGFLGLILTINFIINQLEFDTSYHYISIAPYTCYILSSLGFAVVESEIKQLMNNGMISQQDVEILYFKNGGPLDLAIPRFKAYYDQYVLSLDIAGLLGQNALDNYNFILYEDYGYQQNLTYQQMLSYTLNMMYELQELPFNISNTNISQFYYFENYYNANFKILWPITAKMFTLAYGQKEGIQNKSKIAFSLGLFGTIILVSLIYPFYIYMKKIENQCLEQFTKFQPRLIQQILDVLNLKAKLIDSRIFNKGKSKLGHVNSRRSFKFKKIEKMKVFIAISIIFILLFGYFTTYFVYVLFSMEHYLPHMKNYDAITDIFSFIPGNYGWAYLLANNYNSTSEKIQNILNDYEVFINAIAWRYEQLDKIFNDQYQITLDIEFSSNEYIRNLYALINDDFCQNINLDSKEIQNCQGLLENVSLRGLYQTHKMVTRNLFKLAALNETFPTYDDYVNFINSKTMQDTYEMLYYIDLGYNLLCQIIMNDIIYIVQNVDYFNVLIFVFGLFIMIIALILLWIYFIKRVHMEFMKHKEILQLLPYEKAKMNAWLRAFLLKRL